MAKCLRLALGVAVALTVARVAAVTPDGAGEPPRSLTLDQRAACHLAIENVLWRHRVWPEENRSPKPPLRELVPPERALSLATDALAKSAALDSLGDPLTPPQLQAELDRMARGTRDPKMLGALFAALNNDPYLVIECLVRPSLADARLREWYARHPRVRAVETPAAAGELDDVNGDVEPAAEFPSNDVAPRVVFEDLPYEEWWAEARSTYVASRTLSYAPYQLPPPGGACTDDTWSATNLLPPMSGQRAVWTGSEMIIWNGQAGSRYNPATDRWRAIDRRGPGGADATVWTGTEMIVWSGREDRAAARYNPTTDLWTPVSTVNAPSGRWGATAVWTGQEMILWGGNEEYGLLFDPLGQVDTGSRYNPATDTWTTMSVAGAPFPRHAHAAIWTGTTMVVWGGLVPGGANSIETATGGRYNAATDTWSPTTLTDAPGASAPARAIWNGTRMIVWGGASNVGARYDPLGDTWTAMSTVNAPASRTAHTMIWTGGDAIVWGGRAADGTLLNTGGRYNPNSDSWSSITTADAPTARRGHSAVWTGSQMIVWGGDSHQAIFDTGARYNPASDSWTSTSRVPTPSARWSHTATWTGTEMIVWGGYANAAYVSTGAIYTPATDAWAPLPTANAPTARANAQSVWTGLDVVVFGGGESSGNSPLVAAGGRYRPSTGQWLPMSSVGAPSPRIAFAMVWTGSRVVVWGGWVGFFVSTNTGGQYDPINDSWTPTTLTNAPPGRWNAAYVWTGSRMIVWGNTTSGGGRYDPVADAWQPMNTANEPGLRVRPVTVWTGTEMIVWGGNASAAGTGGRYNPTTDTWLATNLTNAPVYRSSAGGAWNGSEMIVWTTGETSGGVGARYSPATDSWRPISLVRAPTHQSLFQTVWTGTEMIVWGGGEFGTQWAGAVALDTGARYCAPPPPATAPNILTHPANRTAAVGQTVTFEASANGTPAPTYRWQVSLNAGVSWSDISNAPPYNGATTSILTISSVTMTLNGARYRAIATNAAGSATTNAAVLTVTSTTMTLDKTSLRFAAITSGNAFASQTTAQAVRLTQTGPGTVTWTATANQPWLQVTPGSGSGTQTLSVSVMATGGLPPSGMLSGSITFAFNGGASPAGPIAVTLTLMPAGTSAQPAGFVDTPLDNRTGVTGSVPFTGWAIDDVEVERVIICRARFGSEAPGPNPNCNGNPQIFLGTAAFIDGARPDVQAAYPTYPRSSRAGWGFMVLTNMLPNQGNGSYIFYMYAADRDGHTTLLGTRIMGVDNAHATKPFGAIDTPTQGGTASGNAYINFGWALTQAGKSIPFDGSTIQVLIDGVAVGTADYNHFRSDIATFFPGLANSNGAIGFRILDTTTLSNGLHTIVWVVSDSVGSAEGIGSRYFTVSNGVAATATDGDISEATVAPMTSAGAAAIPITSAGVVARRSFELDAEWHYVAPDRAGRTVIRGEELDRFQLSLEPRENERFTGALRTGTGLGPLPIGSRLDSSTGSFTWTPGVGFIGNYDFVFVRWAGATPVARHELRVAIAPKASGAIGPQVVIDTPRSMQTIEQPFMLAGWAADPGAATGTGISALYAWAHPVSGGTPVFLGLLNYGGFRPDVAALHGHRFGPSGFGTIVQGLPPGEYDIAVFAWSIETSAFVPAGVVRVGVR